MKVYRSVESLVYNERENSVTNSVKSPIYSAKVLTTLFDVLLNHNSVEFKLKIQSDLRVVLLYRKYLAKGADGEKPAINMEIVRDKMAQIRSQGSDSRLGIISTYNTLPIYTHSTTNYLLPPAIIHVLIKGKSWDTYAGTYFEFLSTLIMTNGV